MSVPQWILLALVAVVAAWGFACMASLGNKLTLSRSLLALVMPALWAALIAVPPWGDWVARMPDAFDFLFTLAFFGSPFAALLIVAINIIWMQAAISGDWSNIRDMVSRDKP